MDHPHGDLLLVGIEAREIRLGADDGEGALVDRGAVLFVCVAPFPFPSLPRPRTCLHCAITAAHVSACATGLSLTVPSCTRSWALRGADHRECRGRGARATLAAAGNMEPPIAHGARQGRGDFARERMGFDYPRSASRRAGAGIDAGERVIRISDETDRGERLCQGGGRRRKARARARG